MMRATTFRSAILLLISATIVSCREPNPTHSERSTPNVRFVFVTVDPERDTPQVAHEYVMRFDSSFAGLATNVDQLEQIKTAWGFAPGTKGADIAAALKELAR